VKIYVILPACSPACLPACPPLQVCCHHEVYAKGLYKGYRAENVWNGGSSDSVAACIV